MSKGTFYVICCLHFLTVAFAETHSKAGHAVEQVPAACLEEYTKWQEAFTSSSPFGAEKKLQDLSLDEAEFEMLLSKSLMVKGDIIVRMGREYEVLRDGKAIKGNAFRVKVNPDDTTNHQGLDERYNLSRDRDALSAASLAQMIRNNPKGNLLIAVLGKSHVMDYFLMDEAPRAVMYGAQKIDQVTEKFTRGFVEFYNSIDPSLRPMLLPSVEQNLAASGGATTIIEPRFARHDYQPLFELELEKVQEASNRLPIWTPKSLMGGASNPQAAVLLVGENHFVANSATLQNIPSGKCLKAMGFTSVTFVKEGLPRLDRGYSPEFIESMYTLRKRLSNIRYDAGGGKEIPYVEFLQTMSPKSLAVVKKGSIEVTSAETTLAVARRLSKEEIPVHFTGFEPGNYHGKAHVDGEPSQKLMGTLRRWVKVDKEIQIVRKGLLSSGSTGFSMQLSKLWSERDAIESELASFDVIPKPPSGKIAEPSKLTIQLK